MKKVNTQNKTLAALLFLAVTYSLTYAADLTVAAGGFRFWATDYYYPNFYDEAGFRGDITFAFGGGRYRHTIRVLAAGYPMDDNVFDPAVEYGWRLVAESSTPVDVIFEPAGGFQYTKLQYPAPYYPTVEHHFLPWLRLGWDGGLGRALTSRLYLSAAFRFRLLYYLGTWHGAFAASQGGEPSQPVWGPWVESRVKINGRWAALARGGWEWDGWYEEIFLREKSRPYGELGVAYSW